MVAFRLITRGGAVYFHYTLLVGVCALACAAIVTGSFAMLAWMVCMLALFAIQQDAPYRFPIPDARRVFWADVVTQCSLCVALAITTQAVGAILIAVGMSANVLVMLANGGRMPILGEDWNNVCYFEADESTRFVWLCDHLQTTRSKRRHLVISPGDALECIGVWVLAAEILLAA